MVDKYLSVLDEVENEYIIEKSRFICSIKYIEDENDAKEYLETIKKRYNDANHHCYGYIVDNNGTIVKCSDAGEPQGTAGVPILETIKGANLKHIIAVVTRYFGGVKLGASGLLRAYMEAVKLALDKAKYGEWILSTNVNVSLDYTSYGKVLSYFRKENYKVLDTKYSENGEIELIGALPTDKLTFLDSNIQSLTLGKGKIKINNQEFLIY